MQHFGIYVIITNPSLPYGDIARICVRCGVRYLQLREKKLDDKAILAAAAQITAVTKGTETLFVINDRADLALLAAADVLHLGQGDVDVDDARKIVGADMKIGLSTHSIAQAKAAMRHNPEYIGFGPVYPTTTKEHPDPTVGVELLREVVGFATVPVLAIGGIFPENIAQVLQTGVKNVCLVRHLMCDENLEAKIKELQNIIAVC